MAIEINRPKKKRGVPWVVGQGALFILYLFCPSIFSIRLNPGLMGLGILMMGWGCMFAGGGLVTLGRHHGWRNLTPFPEPLKEMTLVTDGAYAYVRHPIYLGILLILIGYSLYAQNILQLVFALLLAVLLNFKSKQEEALLESTYPAYADYAAKVKRLLPGLI